MAIFGQVPSAGFPSLSVVAVGPPPPLHARASSAMDPTRLELLGFTDITSVFEWLELDAEVAKEVTKVMGAAIGLRSWARIPPDRYAKALATVRVGEGTAARELTPAEEGQAGEISRLARLALETKAGLTGPSQAAGGAQAGASALAGAGEASAQHRSGKDHGVEWPEGGAKVKLASVLDQGDDSEVKPLAVESLRDLIGKWKGSCNDGEDPAPDEEATGDQLSALAFRLRSGATPFVDFGVWRPHASALGRSMKFTAHVFSPSGEVTRKEVSGPASFSEWEASWRVFAFGMEVLDAASRTRLKRYRDEIQKMSTDYPTLWWIVACADLKMRQSQFERIRRRLAKEHAGLTAAGLPSEFRPDRPWDLVIREAARDREFWAAEVDKKVVQFVTAQRSQNQLTDPGFGEIRFSADRGVKRPIEDGSVDGHRQDKKRGLPAPKGKSRPDQPVAAAQRSTGARGRTRGGAKADGGKGSKFHKTEAGVQVCWAWNRAGTGRRGSAV